MYWNRTWVGLLAARLRKNSVARPPSIGQLFADCSCDNRDSDCLASADSVEPAVSASIAKVLTMEKMVRIQGQLKTWLDAYEIPKPGKKQAGIKTDHRMVCRSEGATTHDCGEVAPFYERPNQRVTVGRLPGENIIEATRRGINCMVPVGSLTCSDAGHLVKQLSTELFL